MGIVSTAASKTVLGRGDTCKGACHCYKARKKTTKWRLVYSNSWICLFFLQMGYQLCSFHSWPLQGKEMQHLSESSVLILTYFKELPGIKAKTIMWYLAYAIFKSFTLSQLMVDRVVGRENNFLLCFSRSSVSWKRTRCLFTFQFIRQLSGNILSNSF